MVDLMEVRTAAKAVADTLAAEKRGIAENDILPPIEKLVSDFELPFSSPLAEALMRAIQVWCAAGAGHEHDFVRYSKQVRTLARSKTLGTDDSNVIELFLVRAAKRLPGSHGLLAEADIPRRQRTVTIENIDADIEYVLTTLDRKMRRDFRIARTMTKD